jgi:hypothetical protein
MKLKTPTAVGGLLALVASALIWSSARAADHADGPATTAEPAADIDDVYAWMSSDTADLNLVMTVGRDVPSTFKLSDRVQYVFHTQSHAAFGQPAASNVDVICEFDSSAQVECWAGDAEYVRGDASSTSGIQSKSGKLKVFTGVRNDPFYFNLTGFQNVAKTVGTVAGSLTFDAAGCPAVDGPTSNLLVTGLKTGGDSFATFSAYAIVVVLDKTLVTRGGPIVSVWGSTNRK